MPDKQQERDQDPGTGRPIRQKIDISFSSLRGYSHSTTIQSSSSNLTEDLLLPSQRQVGSGL